VNDIASRFKADLQTRQDSSRGMVALVMSNGAFGGLHQKLFEGRGQGPRTERQGQAVVEWLILCFVLVIISVAILSPLRAKFTEIQNELAANTLDVMEQKTLGIPLRWFELEEAPIGPYVACPSLPCGLVLHGHHVCQCSEFDAP